MWHSIKINLICFLAIFSLIIIIPQNGANGQKKKSPEEMKKILMESYHEVSGKIKEFEDSRAKAVKDWDVTNQSMGKLRIQIKNEQKEIESLKKIFPDQPQRWKEKEKNISKWAKEQTDREKLLIKYENQKKHFSDAILILINKRTQIRNELQKYGDYSWLK